MTTKKPQAATTPTPPAPEDSRAHAVTLRYVGPPGQTSPVFGVLVPEQLYPTADADLAVYLATKHPDYWNLADLAPPVTDQE